MSKTPLPFYAADISNLARTIRRRLDDMEQPPSHLKMLNLLAKASGFRNFQHFKAEQIPTEIRQDTPVAEEPNIQRIKQVLRHYDADGHLIRWPKKFSLRMLCLWIMWSTLPSREAMTEPEINAHIKARHHFTDHALLRRELVDRGLVARTNDGRQYTRIERQPPIEAVELFKQIHSINT